MIGKNDVFDVVIPIGDHAATTYLGAAAGTYIRTAWLEKGYLWEVVDFRMVGAASYSPVAASYSFVLANADAATIATVDNAVTTISTNPATGIDASPVARYKTINTKSAGTFLQVRPTQSGAGKAYIGLQAIIRLKRMRTA